MIKFEDGMLVTDATVTKQDVEAIYEYGQKRYDDAVELIKQRLIAARTNLGKQDDADFFWSMHEIMQIIEGRYEDKFPVYYDSEYKGKVPEGAILLEGN